MTTDTELEKLKYPIGRYNPQQELSEQELAQAILAIAQLPQKLRTAVANLTPEQLDTPYRDGGWTVRQVIHHLPDSHLNGYMRQKLALTEDVPTIRPYDEVAWAALPDSLHGDPGISLRLLEALHQRWVLLLQSLTPEQLARKFTHPASGGQSIRQHIGNYAWHGNHHLAHVTELIRREGWDKA